MLLGDAEDKVCVADALPSLASPSKDKSWAAIVNGGGPTAEINMTPLEKKEVAGTRRLLISQQSYEVLCQPFKFSAIATLAGGARKGRLDYSFIFTSLRSIWSGIADLRFTSVGKGMFLLRTSSEDDLKFILSPGRWYVEGRLLIANQWDPSMPMRIESSSRVRIWIRLSELPVEWWNPRVFTDIADLIGGAFVKQMSTQGISRGEKVFVQSIEYETKVKYCQKCGSTAHFDGSCTLTEASKEGEKVAPNAWHLVKVPKRRPQPNKIKENLQLKQNKFEALSQLPKEKADGVSSHDERQYASQLRRVVVTNNAHASINLVSHDFQNGRAEGLDPKTSNPPKSTATGNSPNPLDGYNKAKPAEKAKKRSLKHREGGGQQANQDISMMGADQGSQEDFPLDEMETTIDEGQTGSHDLADVQDGDLANTRLASWEGREHGQPFLKSNEKTGRAPALQACLALSNFVQQSTLHEVSCPDMKFTWTNNRVGHRNVMSKIDTCYVSKEWVDDPDNLLQLEVLPRTTSDHNPILLRISKCKFRTWEIFTACTDYFVSLLGTTEGSGCLPHSLAWGPTVSPEENVDLLKPVSDSEIIWAVMEADRESAPGPNGFGNSFFQSNWLIVREAVSGAIRGFFDSGRLVKSVNKTHITLLPKEPGLAMNISKSSLFSFNMDSRELNWIEHEISWRQEGGVGLREIKETNLANMAYLVYRASQQFERKGLLNSSVRGKRVSHVWRSSPGASADRLMDKIPSSHIHLIHDTITCSFKELLEENGEALMDYLAKLNIHISCPPLQADQLDVMVWRNGENGEFNQHEIWQRVRKKGHHNKDYKLVWQGRQLPRASWIVYVGVSGWLPTDALVQQQGYSLASRCYVCKQATEDVKHLFYDCKGARSLWSSIYGKFGRGASPWCRSPPNLMQGLSSWHKKGFQDKSLDKCWKDNFHMAWNDQQSTKIRSWLRSGILWSNGVSFEDKWVEISITSWYKQGRKGVAGIIRDGPGQVRFGVACWFKPSSRWPETEILSECLGHLVNIADNMGRIYLLANDGEWKHHFLTHIGCMSDIVGNQALSNNFIDMLKICKGWPLAEGSNLLMITPDNGLYTTWNPHETL
ncbi:hypothetical protein EJ110_NYTH45521 [Nymphaea thermarum]|nr:hypothetical protein EJ110_NYTH45521 [Nymphaea thermarum]